MNGPKMSKGTNNRSSKRSLLDADEIGFVEDDMDFDLPPLPPGSSEVGPDARPNPVELPAPINPEGAKKQSVEMHRNLFCVHYDSCLDEAVKKSWNSFTCLRCAFFNDNREHKDEYSDVERFATQRKGW